MWHVTEILPPGFWSLRHPEDEDTEESTVQHTYNGAHEHEVRFRYIKELYMGLI